MTIGEKIYQLRTMAGISQEELAEKISVSRQSVSKWEMSQALPQIDKVLQLCELFGISTDTLLQDNLSVASKKKTGNKYFGTDGFRGEANVNLTSMHAYKVGRFLGWYYSSALSGCANAGYRPRIVVGKDTRRSSYMLEYSLVAGITASGADAYMLHVTTTPSVSYVTRQDDFDCGIMITASHNPFYDNGIKVINRYGEKLDDRTTALIEAYIDGDMQALGLNAEDLPVPHRERVGCIVDYAAGRNRYLGYLISVANHSYKNLRIGLDCANGASWMLAKALFGALGARTYVIGAEPDGLNINMACGSTHIEKLCQLVKEQHLDMGFAFDGDGDRCICVDENGKIVDGDGIMYICGKYLKENGKLKNDTVVTTIMSNYGLYKAFSDIGIKAEKTDVGDRFVHECMAENGYALGGEQSGHIIFSKYATTGDGILTALMIMEIMLRKKQSLSKLTDGFTPFPQHLVNVPVKDKKSAMENGELLKLQKKIENELSGHGRLLIRESGTEPVIRIMVECESEEKCKAYCNILARTVEGG